MKRIIEEEGTEDDEPKIEEFDEEIEKEGLKKTMKKVKEVFHEWEQLNMNKLLFDKVVDVSVVQVPHFIDGVDVMQRRGVLHTVKVPEIQFIAGVSGPSCCATEVQPVLLAAWGLHMTVGGDEVVFQSLRTFFALRPSGR